MGRADSMRKYGFVADTPELCHTSLFSFRHSLIRSLQRLQINNGRRTEIFQHIFDNEHSNKIFIPSAIIQLFYDLSS
jgi:hypothetical protein